MTEKVDSNYIFSEIKRQKGDISAIFINNITIYGDLIDI